MAPNPQPPARGYPASSLVVAIAGILAIPGLAPAEITDEQVRKSIQRGVEYLKKEQNRVSGGWSEHSGEPCGLSALCTLALLTAGQTPDDPAVRHALEYLRRFDKPQKTYSTALQTMVLCLAEPEKDRLQILANVKWLEAAQVVKGDREGAWTYEFGRGGGDPSNTQFALLALHEAERVGVQVSDQTWRRSIAYWRGIQGTDGSWGYGSDRASSSGSMTCAGVGSLVIALGSISNSDAKVEGERVQCCLPPSDHDAVERGLAWLATKFSVHWNPTGNSQRRDTHFLLYYLYGVERVGRLTGRRFIGEHDWYRVGAEKLVGLQDDLAGYWRGAGPFEDNGLIATSFALLFLSKGRRPVVISKLQHGEGLDWDRHRGALQHLTLRLERAWKRDLIWQTINAKAASATDLLQTPVLFISGRDSLDLTPDQKQNLRDYVNQGGFIFAQASCGGQEFDRAFRELVAEIFPDSPLQLLPPDHAIWHAQGKVDPKYLRPLYGVNACCRTSVVYCPDELACYWELDQGARTSAYPPAVRDEIEACVRIGENVVAYATNRELKSKLDLPHVVSVDTGPSFSERGTLVVAKLLHGGGSDDASAALPRLLRELREQVGSRVNLDRVLLPAGDPRLFQHPIVFMHGRRAFQFSAEDRVALARHLERGGFLFADAICASPAFAESFRREMQTIFPDRPLKRIPTDHPIHTGDFRGYDVRKVTIRDPQIRGGDDPLTARLVKGEPQLEAIELDDRIAVIFSPLDLSCALENHASLECKGYIREDATRIGINILLFAMQQ